MSIGRYRKILPDVEAQHVGSVYDAIAPHFSDTRFAIWPGVNQFLTSLSSYALTLDMGCGNGKYLRRSPAKNANETYLIGSDLSQELVTIAAQGAKYEALVADALQSPFRDECADAAMSIAVMHHLSNEERRIQAVRELLRLIKVGGRGLIYVWAREQEDEDATLNKWIKLEMRNDYLVPWYVLSNKGVKDDRVERAKNAGGEWIEEKNAVLLHRFYHVFDKGELDALVTDNFTCVEIERTYWEKSNWAVWLKKISPLPAVVDDQG